MTFWTEFLKEASKTLGFGLLCGASLVAMLGLAYWFLERRVLVRPGRAACRFCGQSFGFTAARAAKRRYKEECAKEHAEIERNHGGSVLVDFNNRWEVECP